ncbi:MAG: S8 family serine peptidase, partial [bacterium]
MKYFVLSFFVFISFNLSGEPPYFYRYGKKISFEKDLEELSLTGKIFVKLKEGTSLEKLEKLFKKYALKEFKRFKYLRNWVLVETTENPVKTASLMVEKNDFSAAEPSFSIQIEKFSILPDDPYFSNQWYLESETKDHAHVISAWESISEMGKIPGEGISVAVIDDGFDIYHEDLEGRFKNWEDLGSASKTDVYNPSVDKHGTACAGIIGASADNGKGTAGVCHSCSLIGVRYDSFQQIDHMAISAIDKAAEMGADIISCSWGVPQSETAANPSFGQPVRELLENIYKEARNGKGSLIVFAAGNDDYDFSTNNGFAANRHVLAVGATDSEGIRSNYSNYGSYLDVTAPSTKGINAF